MGAEIEGELLEAEEVGGGVGEHAGLVGDV